MDRGRKMRKHDGRKESNVLRGGGKKGRSKGRR